MNDNQKIIIVEEREQIPYSNTAIYGEIDPENMPEPKYRVISERKFAVHKFNAKASLKIAKLLVAKILPVVDTFVPAVLGGAIASNGAIITKAGASDSLDKFLSDISLERVSHALDLIDDDDLDRLLDISLRHCYEQLPAGPVRVLNPDGTYGVQNVEYDPLLVMRLTAEAILWSSGVFFNASRWASTFKPLAASLPQSAPT